MLETPYESDARDLMHIFRCPAGMTDPHSHLGLATRAEYIADYVYLYIYMVFASDKRNKHEEIYKKIKNLRIIKK